MKDPYGPKRRITQPLPRASLPPTEGSTPDLADSHWDPEALTQSECPACKSCSLCGGTGMVSCDVAAAYRKQVDGEPDEGGA